MTIDKWHFDTDSLGKYLLNHYGNEKMSLPIRFVYNGKKLDMHNMGVIKGEFVIDLWDRDKAEEELILDSIKFIKNVKNRLRKGDEK
jgi:hypothetical protein